MTGEWETCHRNKDTIEQERGMCKSYLGATGRKRGKKSVRLNAHTYTMRKKVINIKLFVPYPSCVAAAQFQSWEVV